MILIDFFEAFNFTFSAEITGAYHKFRFLQL